MWTSLLEELTLNAWPALQTLHYDGWALRFAEGFTRRSNSVNVLHESTLDLTEKIDHCEAVYAAQGLKAVFKICGQDEAALRAYSDLDTFLEARGYLREAPTSVQVVDLKSSPPAPLNVVERGAEAHFETELSEAWLEVFCRLNAERAEYNHILKRVLQSIIPMRCFMTLEQNGEAVAVGMGVLERGYLCLMGIATDERVRRQGLGTQLMLSLIDWGKSQSAHHAYLQVMCHNQPAIRLYEKLGFAEAYQYWYRVKGD
jgi:N-acetylglutamate synthase